MSYSSKGQHLEFKMIKINQFTNLILIVVIICVAKASYAPSYFKNIIDESDIIFVGKFTLIPKKRYNYFFGEYYEAKMKVDSLLKGSISQKQLDSDGYLKVKMYGRYSTKIGTGVHLLKRQGILKRKVRAWRYYKVCIINDKRVVKVDNPSTQFPLTLISNSITYKANGRLGKFVTFNKFAHSVYRLKSAPPLIRPSFRNHDIFVPQKHELEQFFNDNKTELNKQDSIALFNGVFLENVSITVIHFLLGKPRRTEVTPFNIAIHNYRYVDFYFRNDRLIRIQNRLNQRSKKQIYDDT